MDPAPDFIRLQGCSINEINEAMEYFLDKEMYNDVSFSVKCGDSYIDFSAHKLILSMWSPVFANMCHKSHEGPICIEDVSPKTFKAMLKFMYGSFSNRQLKDIPFLLKLYKAADAYEIDALRNICKNEFVVSTPDVYTVFQFLDAGKLLNCESLVQRCYKILQRKTAEVLSVQELCTITPAMFKTILEMPRVSFTSEYELISWVLAWVKNELLKDPYKTTFRGILEDFLPYLNFLNLSSEGFARLFESRKSDLMSEEEALSIFMNIALPGSYPLPSWCSSSPKRRLYRNHNSDSPSLSSMDSINESLRV